MGGGGGGREKRDGSKKDRSFLDLNVRSTA